VADWQRLMSRPDGPLRKRQQQTIVQLWARHLCWSVEEEQAAAQAQRLDLSRDAIRQIGQHSGLLLARRVLPERFQLGPELLRLKHAWLVQQLFTLLDQLQARLEAGERPRPAQRCGLADLRALRQELGLGSAGDLPQPLPWADHLQQVRCGDWPAVNDARIRCRHCGTEQVRRLSRKPRTKGYRDA
jgi:hypothetical protein